MSKKNEVTTDANVITEATSHAVSGEVLSPLPATAPATKRLHRATFATDNIEGGYMVRVEGPNADKFAKRTIPVTRFNGEETEIELKSMTWTGPDKVTGVKVALYKIVKHPRVKVDADAIAF